jgi:FHA domain/RING-variant domain
MEEGMGKPDEEDFFVSPCNCKGSCEFVHIQCLKQWIRSKTLIKPTGCALTYLWKNLECEVCKKGLPKKMKLNDQIIELVTIEKPQTAYLLLEKFCRETRTISSATIIQFLSGEIIKIGRGHQCDLRISDISVSRYHSKIVYEKGQFRIYDNNSKFGTLVMLQDPFRITEEKVAVQVGRTVVTFAQRKDKEARPPGEFLLPSFNGMHAQLGSQSYPTFLMPQTQDSFPFPGHFDNGCNEANFSSNSFLEQYATSPNGNGFSNFNTNNPGQPKPDGPSKNNKGPRS